MVRPLLFALGSAALLTAAACSDCHKSSLCGDDGRVYSACAGLPDGVTSVPDFCCALAPGSTGSSSAGSGSGSGSTGSAGSGRCALPAECRPQTPGACLAPGTVLLPDGGIADGGSTLPDGGILTPDGGTVGPDGGA